MLTPPSVHDRLCALARAQSALDKDLGEALLAAYRECVHVSLGYGSFREYAARILGWTGRHTEERLRVALALEQLPELAARAGPRATSSAWSPVTS